LLVAGHGRGALWCVNERVPRKIAQFEFPSVAVMSPDSTCVTITDYQRGVAELWDAAVLERRATLRWAGPTSPDNNFFPPMPLCSPVGGFVALTGTKRPGTRVVDRLEKVGASLGLWDKFRERSQSQLWDIRTGTCLATFDGNASFAPDGSSLLLVTDKGRIELWDLPLRRPLKYAVAICLSAVLVGAVLVWWFRAVRHHSNRR
jgi:WD40 repeat protein